jgi:hypothetical protein
MGSGDVSGAAPGVPGPPSAQEWLAAFAERLGVDPPDPATVEELLALAGTAAHSSERIAAPLACWLVGRAGVAPPDAGRLAAEIAPAPD